MKTHIIIAGILAAAMFSACSDDDLQGPKPESENGKICLSGEIDQQYISRVNDNGFVDGDVMGVYIVDWQGNQPGTLLTSGNRGDNVRHTFDEANYRWNSAFDLFWKDNHTRIDVYGYYPASSPQDVNNYRFTVKNDQNYVPDDGTMGYYEASDFLWGKVSGVEPTTSVIRLPLAHRMANARVTLIEGNGFTEGEWTTLEKQVLVVNTVQDAVIDLATGIVKPEGSAGGAIIPSKRDNEWRAIVVPQTIAGGTTMFTITLGGIPYKFSKSEDFEYMSGKMSNFGIRVDKKEATGDYTLTLVSESITAWENDLVSHDASAKEYVVVDVPEPGKLQECIAAAGKDYKNLRNLKITGRINALDFYFMRDQMTNLQAINLKEVRIKGSNETGKKDDQIPSQAFKNKKSLISMILPDNIKSIGYRAFDQCQNLTGSLMIPEGVVEIQSEAFNGCRGLTGILSLPSTLKYIGIYERDDGKFSNGSSAFSGCNFNCELNIPNNVEIIAASSFSGCPFYGSLRLPENLKRLGSGAFSECHFSGSLVIPQGVTEIPSYAFARCNFDGILQLHDGINIIGESAFEDCEFKGQLVLPKNLKVLDKNVFRYCDFSGELILPKDLKIIGEGAFFVNSRLSGKLEIPEGVSSIGNGAFSGCRGLEELVLPESLESIGYVAFSQCSGLSSIICKSELPPYLQERVFDEVPKDNFVLEVPEASVMNYSTTAGWREFKRIAAHHELVCRPSVACALSNQHRETLIIDAEGDWEVESMPSWCSLSKTSGSRKDETEITINATSASDSREGEVVFKLKGKDYTHSCHVTQYGYPYGEDEVLTLQKATRGNNGGINIVILGDGYNAKDIADGTYLADMKQQIEYFFGIEPYTTYRDYFNVYTVFPLSQESGVGTVNTIRYNKFETTFTQGVGLKCDYDLVFRYAKMAPTVDNSNIDQTLIIMVPNSTDYGGVTQMWESGAAIAFCPKTTYSYPLDSRGLIQHEAGGHGFGKLADEYIYHNAFIDDCSCSDEHVSEFKAAKRLGWYDNLELTARRHEVGWSHLLYHPKYMNIVDIYEGGFFHSRGVFRSEQNSCMNNNIPYYSTISRESIVRRIKKYAGEQFSFDDFVANDKLTAQTVASRGTDMSGRSIRSYSCPPVIHKGSPMKSSQRSAMKTKK